MAPAVQKGQGEGSRTDDIRHADPNIDNRRRGRFHVGWKDAADRGKTYGETALARLTWQNVGWRLDYHLATPKIAKTAKHEHIYLEQRFSDHAPLVMDYDFSL